MDISPSLRTVNFWSKVNHITRTYCRQKNKENLKPTRAANTQRLHLHGSISTSMDVNTYKTKDNVDTINTIFTI